jgi:hypothetical protein
MLKVDQRFSHKKEEPHNTARYLTYIYTNTCEIKVHEYFVDGVQHTTLQKVCATPQWKWLLGLESQLLKV